MAFWDEFKEKITQGSQEAIQKTKDIADVMTLNAEISESKRKIRELNRELGELLVQEAFADMTSAEITAALEDEAADDASHAVVIRNWREFYDKVRFIKSEQEVIAIDEAKIEGLKAESKCPGCGCKISKGMLFCPECGMKLAQPQAEQTQTASPEPEKAAEQQAEPEPEPESKAEVPEPDTCREDVQETAE